MRYTSRMLDYDLVTATAAYRILTPKDAESFMALVEKYHAENGTGRHEGTQRTLATVRELDRNKRAGSIFVIERGPEVVGYSIVVTRWDNERAGNVLCLDELYVLPAHRGLGIATDFVELLAKIAPSGAVAIELRVPAKSRKAAAWSKRLGFAEPWSRTVVREIAGP
jgi:GNAT superfamily N-acetyltransferase